MINTLKRSLKSSLKKTPIVSKYASSANYWLTNFDPKTDHPRRLTVQFYKQFLTKGDLCFDIGANFGQRTSIFLELGTKVVAIEPQSKCMEKLFKEYRNNPHITLISKAVADREDSMEISICEDLPSISSMSENWRKNSIHAQEYGYQWTKKESVETTTLDNLISEYGMPRFCKIDVEGFEEKVLQGLSQPIPCLSFEFNTGFFTELNSCINQIETIENYRFNFATGEPSSGEGLVMDNWVTRQKLMQELERRAIEDKFLWGDVYAKVFH